VTSSAISAEVKRFRNLVRASALLSSVRDVFSDLELYAAVRHIDAAQAGIIRELDSLQDKAYADPNFLQSFASESERAN
jgi:hypothetical protein